MRTPKERADVIATCRSINSARARWERLVPQRFQDASLHSGPAVEPTVVEWTEATIAAFVAGRVPPGNLFLTGPSGSGKTTTAWAVMRHLHDAFLTWWGLSSADLMAVLKDFDPKSPRLGLIHRLENTWILLLDDLGAEQVTEWSKEQLNMLADYRYREVLPTVITSNLSTLDLIELYGDRIVRRLLDNATVVAR